jgi:hypothetical protein
VVLTWDSHKNKELEQSVRNQVLSPLVCFVMSN